MFWHRAIQLAVAASLFLNVFPLCLFRVICSLLHYGDTAMIRARAPHAVKNVRSDTPRNDAAKGVETRACLGGADTRVSSPVLPTNYRYYDPLPFLKVPP